jgi:gliding motility-associated-like protein
MAQGLFVANKGQWPTEVLYRADIEGGYLYIDQKGMAVQMLESAFFEKLHNWVQGTGPDSTARAHALHMRLKGAQLSEADETAESATYPLHFFLSNDPSAWATDVPSHGRLRFNNVYPGVDLRFIAHRGQVKYEYLVAPGASAATIANEIQGALSIHIDAEGALVVGTSVGEYREQPPFAYQLSDKGSIVPVACRYRLSPNGVVTYHFPKGYDRNRELVIDPELAFSTYAGSVSNSFGFTACYDNDGALYAGGITFGAQYPVTPGAYQISFAQGAIDCTLSKFSPDGTQLVYSTYLGAPGNEAPHSTVTDAQGNLYILGSTSSTSFPTTPFAYQVSHAGGFTTPGVGYSYQGGTDIFVSKLGPNGNALLASTYLGGFGNDGVSTGTNLDYNYGDRFRGEIVVDQQGNPYIASVTNSMNFPIVNGYASTGNPEVSGVVVKLNQNFSSIIWSTYIGGSDAESAISLQLAPDNTVYVTGGTRSTDLPVTPGAYQSTLSGNVEGYIAHISADGSTLLHCTYNGTVAFDQNYFVQLDTEGNVYVVGQSLGSYPVTPGVYANPGSRQFVQKFSPDLSASLWSTVIGSGSNQVNIAPSAFLVSDCGQIYISGWGGAVNAGAGGNTQGMPVTDGAFQTTTDGSDFYVMVLGVNASNLAYATYFGGNQSAEHVDGGTSRFDKNGTVYQAVCAGCWANSDFPTQPGVWSQANLSTGCNLAVFKFKLGSVRAQAEVNAPSVICPGDVVSFINLSVDADVFTWNFGDGNTSSAFEPQHAYTAPGTYTVTLHAANSEGCLLPDSVIFQIEVGIAPDLDVEIPPVVCPGVPVVLSASGADTWLWSPAAGLSSTTSANPTFTGNATTTYSLIGTTTCGSATVKVTVVVNGVNTTISENTSICPGEAVQLSATGGATYAWSPTTGLNNPSVANPMASPETTTNYTVSITTAEGCQITNQVEVTVLPPAPVLSGQDMYSNCNGNGVQLSATGSGAFTWVPATGLSSTTISNPVANPAQTTLYTVTASNSCGSDQLLVTVLVNTLNLSVEVDSVVCFNESFLMRGKGASRYSWEPRDLVFQPDSQETGAMIERTTQFTMYGYDEFGCSAGIQFFVQAYPRVQFRAGNDRIVHTGEVVTLEPFSLWPITWEYHPALSCTECMYPLASPTETTTFYASVVTDDGCRQIDSVMVGVRGVIYVPNAFTPNGDGLNDIFRAKGVDIVAFRMEVWNRWGERVFIGEHIDHGWNGSAFGGEYYCPAGVYPYRIVARERFGDVFELKGHVTLIR